MGHQSPSSLPQDAPHSPAYAHKPHIEPSPKISKDTDNTLVKHYEKNPSANSNVSSPHHGNQQPMASSLAETVTPYESLVPWGNGTPTSVTAMRTAAVLEPATGDTGLSSLYATYDPMTGVRTAAMLGSLLLILILYIGYKAKCGKSHDEDSWTEEDDKWCQKYQEKYEEKLSLRERQSSINPSEAPLEKEPSIDKTRNWIASQPLCSDLAEGDKRLLDNKMKLSMQSRQSSVSMEDLTSLSRSHDIQVIISCDTDDSRQPLRPIDDIMSRRRYKKSHSMDHHSLTVRHVPVKSHSMDTSMYNDEEILEMQRLNLPRVWITDMDAIDTHTPPPRSQGSSRPRPKLRRQSSAKSDSGNLIDLSPDSSMETPLYISGVERSPLQRAVSSPVEEPTSCQRPHNISLPNIQLFPPSPCDTPPTCLLMGSQLLPHSRPHRPGSLDVPDTERADKRHRRRLKSVDVPRGRPRPRSPSRQLSLEVGGMHALPGGPQRQHSLDVAGQGRRRSSSRQMSLEVPGQTLAVPGQGRQRSPSRQMSLEVPGQTLAVPGQGRPRSPSRQMSLEVPGQTLAVPGQGRPRSPSRQMSLEVPGQTLAVPGQGRPRSQSRQMSLEVPGQTLAVPGQGQGHGRPRSPSRQMSLEVPGQGQQRSPSRQKSLEVPGQGRRRSRQMSLEVPGQNQPRSSSLAVPCESHNLPRPHGHQKSLEVPGQGRRPSRPRSLSRQKSMDVSGDVAGPPRSRQQSTEVPAVTQGSRSPHRQNSTPTYLPVTPTYGEGAGHKSPHERPRSQRSHRDKHSHRSPKMQGKTRSAEEERTAQQQAAAPCFHSTPCLRQSISPHSPQPSPHLAPPPPRECPSPQPVPPGVSLALQECPSRSHQQAAQTAYKLSPQTANYIRLAQPDPARRQVSDPGQRRDNTTERTSAARRKDGWTDKRKHHSDPYPPLEPQRFLTPNTLQVPKETYNLPVTNLSKSPAESLSQSSHSIYCTPLTTPEKPIPLDEFSNFTKQMNELTDRSTPDVSPTLINTISRV